MGVISPIAAGCRPLSRVSRRSRNDEGNELPLFRDLAAASSSRMLYPFSNPNEVELSLAAASSDRFKRVPSFGLSIQTSLKSDLLTNELEKTESNWLLTPPDSPLFPSLDFEAEGAIFSPKPKPSSPLSRTSEGDGKRKREVACKKCRTNSDKIPEKQFEHRVEKRLKNKLSTWKHVGTMGRF